MTNYLKKSRSGPPHVACIVETTMAFGREIFWGVAQDPGDN